MSPGLVFVAVMVVLLFCVYWMWVPIDPRPSIDIGRIWE